MTDLFSLDAISWMFVLAGLATLIPYTGREARWSTWVELGLAGSCGYLALYLSNVYIVDHYIREGMLVASDYTRYCQNIGALRAGDLGRYVMMQGLLPGLLPAWLARSVGVLDALLYTAMLATFIAGAGLYLWGRALGGRTAGILSALFFSTVAPLAVMVRTPTFYPEMTAVFIGTMAGTALALRYRHPLSLLLAGIGLALSLLVDVRGLLWALPLLVLNLIACLPSGWQGPRRAAGQTLLKLLLLTAPILASYPLGRRAYLPGSTPLEKQTELGFAAQASNLGGSYPPTLRSPGYAGFLWGYSGLSSIPRAISLISQQQSLLIEALDSAQQAPSPQSAAGAPRQQLVEALRAQLVYPWAGLVLSCLVIAVLIKRRNHQQLLAFIGTCSVPLLMLIQSSRYLIMARFIQIPSAVLPVLFGTATAALALRFSPLGGAGPGYLRWRQWARPVAVIGACALLVSGRIDSYLSPGAGWRIPLEADPSISQIYRIAQHSGVTHSQRDTICAEYIQYDLQTLGLPPASRLYPGALSR